MVITSIHYTISWLINRLVTGEGLLVPMAVTGCESRWVPPEVFGTSVRRIPMERLAREA